MFVKDDIKYIGVTDRLIDLFEGQYQLTDGISYNSYVILDDKIAVFDTVDKDFKDEWLNNLKRELNGRKPDYLIVQHMEPDHSSNILEFVKEYSDIKIVATEKAFQMMNQFFTYDFSPMKIAVKENDTLNLGKHTLKFIMAPMVHWPEVMVTYDESAKVLFTADAFGKFGDPLNNDKWDDEARRYYIGIVGKYGMQVQSLLKKASSLAIDTICSLHGPVLTGDKITNALKLYDIWSSYVPECDGVVINYTSVYGNTKGAVLYLKEKLESKGVSVTVNDLARCDMKKAVADSFKYSKTVLATTTYNNEIFPPMREFIANLTERNFKGRKIGIIENGSWAPMAAKVIKSKFENSKDIEFLENICTIKSAVKDENKITLDKMAEELI